jgi:hypothetical protein
MKAYSCVYRRKHPSAGDIRRTRLAGAADPLVGTFFESYAADTSYLDWGDDPSFFSAQHRLGDIRSASWGVCRPDVRAAVTVGDFVVFFCGQAAQDKSRRWECFYVGVGTVAGLHSRQEIWSSESLTPYRSFYNVIAHWSANGLTQQETFWPYHENWIERAASPYILFDPSMTAFNVHDPLHVATYSGALPETWHLESSRVREVYQLLFDGRSDRKGLRTSRTGYGHAKLNLTWPKGSGVASLSLIARRSALLDLVRVAA